MIQNISVLDSIAKKLNDNFDNYDIYVEKNDEEIKKPTFFLSLSLLNSDTFKYWTEKTINIYITYTNLNINIEEIIQIENKLDELFGMYIDVDDYNMVFNSKKFNKTDDSVTLTINVDFIDGVTFIMPQEHSTSNSLMETLNMDIK